DTRPFWLARIGNDREIVLPANPIPMVVVQGHRADRTSGMVILPPNLDDRPGRMHGVQPIDRFRSAQQRPGIERELGKTVTAEKGTAEVVQSTNRLAFFFDTGNGAYQLGNHPDPPSERSRSVRTTRGTRRRAPRAQPIGWIAHKLGGQAQLGS